MAVVFTSPVRALAEGAWRWLINWSVTRDDAGDADQERNYRGVKRRHHYRPVLHLRHFAALDGLVCVNDRLGGTFRQKPENIGFEKYLYSPDDEAARADDSFEDWLHEHVDSPAAEPLRLIIHGTQLSRWQRSRLAAFIANQDLRTPRGRDWLLASYQAVLNREYAEWKGDIKRMRLDIWRRTGTWYSIAEATALADTHDVIAAKGEWLNYMAESLNLGGERVFNLRWESIPAPSGIEFITSDIGIVKFSGGLDYPVAWSPGFADGAITHWFVPLSPKIGLTLSPERDTRKFRASKAWVRAVNRQLTLDATRFVYSQREAPYVRRWWES